MVFDGGPNNRALLIRGAGPLTDSRHLALPEATLHLLRCRTQGKNLPFPMSFDEWIRSC
jgi:hypothetical protein